MYGNTPLVLAATGITTTTAAAATTGLTPFGVCIIAMAVLIGGLVLRALAHRIAQSQK